MKTYIVYLNGIEIDMIQAGSHNAAEKKAIKKYSQPRIVNGQLVSASQGQVSVAYTEI